MGKLNVDGTEIQVLQIEEDDYISLTDMVRKIDNGPALIEKWLRNKNTIEFLGIWEEMYNADFNTAPFCLAPNSCIQECSSILAARHASALPISFLCMSLQSCRRLYQMGD